MSGAEIAGLVAGIAAVCGPARKLARHLWAAYRHDEGIAYEISRMCRRIRHSGNSIEFSLECLNNAIHEDTSSQTVQQLRRLRLLPDLHEHAELVANQLLESYSNLVKAENESSFRRRFEWVRSRKKMLASILPDLDILQSSLTLIHTSMRKAIVAGIKTDDPTVVKFLKEENKRLKLELALHEVGFAELLKTIKHSTEEWSGSTVLCDAESLSRLEKMLLDVSRTAQKLDEEPTRHRTSRSQTQSEALTTYQSPRPGRGYCRDEETPPTVLSQGHLQSPPNPQAEMADIIGREQTTRPADGTQDTTPGHICSPESFSNVRSIATEVVLPNEDEGSMVYQARSGFISPTSERVRDYRNTIVFVAESIEENLISVRKAQELNLQLVEREEEEKGEEKGWLRWVVAQDGSRSKVVGNAEAYWWSRSPQEPRRMKLRLWVCEYLKAGVILGQPFLARERHQVSRE